MGQRRSVKVRFPLRSMAALGPRPGSAQTGVRPLHLGHKRSYANDRCRATQHRVCNDIAESVLNYWLLGQRLGLERKWEHEELAKHIREDDTGIGMVAPTLVAGSPMT